MEFSKKGTMDPMNGHFSFINGLESVNGIQFSLCGTPTNLIFAHKVSIKFPQVSVKFLPYNYNSCPNFVPNATCAKEARGCNFLKSHFRKVRAPPPKYDLNYTPLRMTVSICIVRASLGNILKYEQLLSRIT